MHAGTGPCIAQEAQANRGRVSAFRLDIRGCNKTRCCRCGEMRKVTEPIQDPFATIPTSLLSGCRGASSREESPQCAARRAWDGQNARLRTKTSNSAKGIFVVRVCTQEAQEQKYIPTSRGLRCHQKRLESRVVESQLLAKRIYAGQPASSVTLRAKAC